MADQVQQPSLLSQILDIGKSLGSEYISLDTQRRKEAEAAAYAKAELARTERSESIAGQLMPQMTAFTNAIAGYVQENPIVKYGGILTGVGIAVAVFLYMKKK